MLKSLPQTAPSPALSPRYHYAPKSRSTSSSPSLRRASQSVSQIKCPPPRILNPVQYVDASTQWSPIMVANGNTEIKEEEEQQAPEEKVVVAPVEEMKSIPMVERPPEPTIAGESPGIKRRQSRVESLSATTQLLPVKKPKANDKDVKVLPLKYEFCPVEDLVVLIASMISELILTNDNLPPKAGALTRFHSRTPPGISVHDYLQRLAKHATLIPPILLSIVYYMDRLCLLYSDFAINTLTIHRFLITAATVAAKGLSDSFWNNATYARVGGIKIAELGLLELDFLYRVDWKIVPKPEALEDYYRWLIGRSADYDIESGEGSSTSSSSSSIADDDDSEEAEDEEESTSKFKRPGLATRRSENLVPKYAPNNEEKTRVIQEANGVKNDVS